MYRHSIHTYICLIHQLQGPRVSDISVTVNKPNAQVLVSNTTIQEKEPGLLGEWGNGRF